MDHERTADMRSRDPQCVGICIAILVAVLACAASASASPLIQKVWTDKAQYRTGDAVIVFVQLYNLTGGSWTGDVRVKPRFLGRSLGLDTQQSATIAAGATQTKTFVLLPASPLDRGYLVEVECVTAGGSVTDADTTAYDFSADWTKFPRYGFLTHFNDDTVAADTIDPLRDYKINVVQYYDWMDEHHIPYRGGFNYWQDIAARSPWVSKAKLSELIARGHAYNIAAMAYNAMYSAYDDYQSDGVSLSWGAFTVPLGGGSYSLADQDRHELNISGWETQRLYTFDPRSQGWRDWIAQQFQTVFANIAFDGWHIDTLGYRGQLHDYSGDAFALDATYAGFVNDMRTQLGGGVSLVVNTVSNYGLSQVAQNADVDIIYTELWDGVSERDFLDLKSVTDAVRSYTDKSIVIAGYMNYNAAKTFSTELPGLFNEHAVLLADAAIFANGGWHIELGDGLGMLSSEYFPHQALILSDNARAKLLSYYNFAVAYENLLRDGATDGGRRIDFDLGGSTAGGTNAAAGQVWKLSKRTPGFDADSYFSVAHLINLYTVGSTLWRDPNSSTTNPPTFVNKPVRIYYDGPWGESSVWFASPDNDGGIATQVTTYTNAYDAAEDQWYIEFTLPSLHYWTMFWLERRPQTPYYGSPLAIPGVIQAEDFDFGGEGFAYHDCAAGNQGGAYRPDEDVDIESAVEGGYDVGWMCAGEWIEYTVQVECSTTYLLEARVASGLNGGVFHIEADGQDITGPLNIPATGGWQNWVSVSTLVTLSAGEHVLRFVNDSDVGEQFNVNEFRFMLVGDLNADNAVDLTDLGILLGHYGVGSLPTEGDLSGDGQVDLTDLGMLLGNYGATCP